MGFFSYLDRLRKAPLEERQKVAVTYTVVVIVLIAFGWLVALGFRFGFFENSSSKNTPNQAPNSGIEAPY